MGNALKVAALAYADDVTVIIKNQLEMDALTCQLIWYEEAAGAKLNPSKTEGVWIGDEVDKTNINIQIKQKIKILGLTICNFDCSETNWENKLCEVKNEVSKWQNKNTNYKSRVNIVKTFILSKLLFLANIFPPSENMIRRINKQCVNLVWGTTRKVTKRIHVQKQRSWGPWCC